MRNVCLGTSNECGERGFFLVSALPFLFLLDYILDFFFMDIFTFGLCIQTVF